MNSKILITGGLGYIGSHISHLLNDRAIIIDNMSNSCLDYKNLLPKAKIYVNDLNKKNLEKIFEMNEIDSVIHMASLKSVPESKKNPLEYYENNVVSTLDLLQTMKSYKVNKLIFSSSATVYSERNKCPFKEDDMLESTNPYGNTKLVIERLIDDFSLSNKNFKAISLRYFNPIGADTDAKLSEAPLGDPENLMPILIENVKQDSVFSVYGNDYNTKDGTCIRDFIHVQDLAYGHIKALNKINLIEGHEKINLGLGKGISVLELIKIFESIIGKRIKHKFVKRRDGDTEKSVANINKALELLHWKPKYDYQDMIKSAWDTTNFS